MWCPPTLALCALSTLAGCGADPAPTALRVNPATAELAVGQTVTLGAFVVVEGSSQPAGDGVTWTADDLAVVELTAATDGDATVRGLTAGTTQVHAAFEGVAGNATITVGDAPAVIATSPADGATAVVVPTDISVAFSSAMDGATLTAQITAGGCIGAVQLSRDDFATCLAFAGPATLSTGDTVATLTPMPALAHAATYKLRVTTAARSATDLALASAYTQTTGFMTGPAEPCATSLVISQIYGGSGGTGSPYANDFIELHNAGATPVALGGKAIQYAGAGGTGTWGVQALPTVTLAAGAYYLIQEGSGGATGAALPTPDFVPGTPFGMSPTAGKVALTSTTAALNGTCPGANVLDRVGYGTTANCVEGANPAPAPSNTTAVLRRGDGCIDATENGTDFVAGAPMPRTRASAASVCACLLGGP